MMSMPRSRPHQWPLLAFRLYWPRLWMRFAGLGAFGRLATRTATWLAPPYKARHYLAMLNPHGYVAASAELYHPHIRRGGHVFIGERVIIFRGPNGGPITFGDFANVWGDSLFETGEGGSITLGAHARVNRGVQLVAYKAPIEIGTDAGLGSNSAFYSYDHGTEPDVPYLQQPLTTRGPIVVGDHAWIGVGVIVLSGVRIGAHAVVAAGSVVTSDIPDRAIAAGAPARVIKVR
jgi:acetyltransferase-like isoleucine patch superfamily enzyme